MARSDVGSMLRYIRGLVGAGRLGDLPDRQLLQRFVALREEAAYAALLQRHGPMVLGVCRRVLRQPQDVEDAFQATFLLLARGADSIRQPDAVGGWLHGVARRVAGKLRSKGLRQPPADGAVPGPSRPEQAAPDPTEEATWKELRSVLDEELARLPLELRAPLVLCYLEGRTQDEGAGQLGWTRRVFRRRLEKGRARLSRRLAGRGITLSAALFATIMSQSAAAVHDSLRLPTLRAALAASAGQTQAMPAAVKGLAESVYPTLAASKGRGLLAVLLALNLAVTALSVTLALAGQQAPTPPGAAATPRATDPPPSPAVAPEGVELSGATAVLRGRVVDDAGKPVPNAAVAALARRPYAPGEHGQRHDLLRQGRADAEGNFRLTVPADFRTWHAERAVALWASAPGHGPGTLTVALHRGQPVLTVSLAPGRPLRGKLVDPQGKPAAGVRLEVVRIGSVLREVIQTPGERRKGEEGKKDPDAVAPFDLWPAAAVTNAFGDFDVPDLGVVRNVWVQVQDDRFAVSTFPVEFSDGRPIDGLPYSVMLTPGQVVEGVVTAADTGKPIPGARLTAVSPIELTAAPRRALHLFAPEGAPRSAHDEYDARADGEGRFRLRLPSGKFFYVEVHAPPGSPYLPVARQIVRRPADARSREDFALRRGVLLTGTVRDNGGQAVAGAVACYVPDPDNALAPSGMRSSFDSPAVSGADGRLSLAVPAGRGRLVVQASSGGYVPQPYPLRGPGKGGVSFADGVVELDLPADRDAAKVEVTFKKGVSVTGKVVDPAGNPVASAVLLSARHVHPLTPATARPLPVAAGEFSLPGCEPGQSYPVLILDAAKQMGALADLMVKPGAEPPLVSLQPCGQATVRFVDADGRPVANAFVTPSVLLDPGAGDGRAAEALRKAASYPHEAAWAEPMQYSHCLGPHTEADGHYTLSALVPGASYVLSYHSGGRTRTTAPFTVRSGEALRLPDVVIEADPASGTR